MRFFLGALVVLFNLADNTTTFWCLQAPVRGFDVVEANPVARWIFESLGLLEGLAFEMVVTSAAIAFLVATRRVSHRLKLGLLVALAILPAAASLNNLMVMRAIGLEIPWL